MNRTTQKFSLWTMEGEVVRVHVEMMLKAAQVLNRREREVNYTLTEDKKTHLLLMRTA